MADFEKQCERCGGCRILAAAWRLPPGALRSRFAIRELAFGERLFGAATRCCPEEIMV